MEKVLVLLLMSGLLYGTGRYINVNLHSESKFWDLGLLRINGGLPAEKCVLLLSEKLNQLVCH